MDDSAITNETVPQSSLQSTLALQPAIIVIFGITGDLAKRYLMPSLYRLFRDGLLHEKTEIVGVSRREVDIEQLLSTIELCVSEVDKRCDPAILARLRNRTRMRQLDMADVDGFKALRQALDKLEEANGVCMNRLYYLSVPPTATHQIVDNMGKAVLNASCQHGAAHTRLLIEKPFGHDLESAQKLIDATAKVFGEEQVFRIDHYMAKETAQNISIFRFENPLFESVWNRHHVTSIDIVASEKIGIEGRAELYDQQGALRDFIQNHLLQLLAIATMDRPKRVSAGFNSDAVHAAKLALLEAVQPITARQVASQTLRGQYAGYRDEAGKPKSHTETFAAIRTTINSPRWQGVPITIRTGKAMADRYSSITFTFKGRGDNQTNALRFRIQPNEGIELCLIAKQPSFDHKLQPVVMDFSYGEHFNGPHPSAYERVISDAARGDRTLFASSQEVLAAWRVVDEVVKAWKANGDGLIAYESGTPIDKLGFKVAADPDEAKT